MEVTLEEKKLFNETYAERFKEVHKISDPELSIYIDEYAEKMLEEREKIAIQVYGWKFYKHLGLLHSAKKSIGRMGSC